MKGDISYPFNKDSIIRIMLIHGDMLSLNTSDDLHIITTWKYRYLKRKFMLMKALKVNNSC